MSGIYTIVSDSANGLFRFKQAARPWEDRTGPETLADKARDAAAGFALDPAFVRGAAAAKAALEESRNIANPKAAAEDRIARVERRLKEIRSEARIAAARGDREKLASLAREAAQLARGAGRAAKEYASGVAAAAKMGVGGEDRNGSGIGTVIESTTRVSQSNTTVQVREIEFSLTVTVPGEGEGAEPTTLSYTTSSQSTSVEANAWEWESSATVAARGNTDMALDLPGEVGAALAAVGRPIGGFGTPEGRQLLATMLDDGDKSISRYKEADAFARRVEGAIGDAKAVIGEAKAANANEPDAKRRAERRKELDELEKSLSEAREEVNDLRGSAFGSSLTLSDVAAALMSAGDAGGATGVVADAGVDSLGDSGVGVGLDPGVDAASGFMMVDSAPLVDVTA